MLFLNTTHHLSLIRPSLHLKKNLYLGFLVTLHLRPCTHGQSWCILKTKPPADISHASPSFKKFLQMLTPCCFAQQKPGWQSFVVSHKLPGDPFVFGVLQRPQRHFRPLQQLPSRRQISFPNLQRWHFLEYKLHVSSSKQSSSFLHT